MNPLALRLHIGLIRMGWMIPAVVVLAVISVALFAWWLPSERVALKHAKTEFAKASAELSHPPSKVVVPQATSTHHLAVFYRALGRYPEIETPISTFFQIAGDTALALKQGDYQAVYERAGRYYAYRITLPVRGSYSNIRKFCDQALTAIPYAALDGLQFKRASISDPNIEAKLQFTLYFGGQSPTLDSTPPTPSATEGTL
ncbi:hypothetical protein N5J06_20175 [Ralstonia sp. CHL-2022]|uniref:Transmembrane protein n=1 Tax=Ralstonia mojiangensis TaxID=2953895 RepID=A0ABT2LF26_9RALS|nr:hypothetical protein [Ralstonia mojiangensis]MCT7313298.1 hypothetical protein [Ralstonia mojiangensis]